MSNPHASNHVGCQRTILFKELKKHKGREGSSLPFTLMRREVTFFNNNDDIPHCYYNRCLLKIKKTTRRGTSHPFLTIG
jgi:hypothetical protein